MEQANDETSGTSKRMKFVKDEFKYLHLISSSACCSPLLLFFSGDLFSFSSNEYPLTEFFHISGSHPNGNIFKFIHFSATKSETVTSFSLLPKKKIAWKMNEKGVNRIQSKWIRSLAHRFSRSSCIGHCFQCVYCFTIQMKSLKS